MMSSAIENTLANEKTKFINAKNTINDTKRRAQQRLIRGISEKERAAENIAELQAQMEMQSKQVSKRLEEVLADVQMKIEKEVRLEQTAAFLTCVCLAVPMPILFLSA